MTTEAVSRNIITPLPVEQITNWGPPPLTYYQSIGKQDYEQRPKSVSVPLENGFRQCAPWNHSGAKWTKGTGSFRFGSVSGNQTLYVGCIEQGGFPVPVAPSVNLQNKGLQKALNKLKNQDIHLGTFIAEGRQTVKMVAHAARTIARQVTKFRETYQRGPKYWRHLWSEVVNRQNFANRKRRKCDIPGAWLELQYGWTPLLADIHGALQHLQKGKRLPVVTVSSNVTDEMIIRRETSFEGGAWGYRNFRQKWDVNTYLHYGLDNNNLAELSSLGLVNPAEIAWELLPYSFVIDWFLPVGNWISALTADKGYRFLTGGQSRKATLVPEGDVEVVWRPTSTLAFNPPRLSGRAEHMTRTCYSDTPIPGLYVKNPISGLHVANAIALLVQAFRPSRNTSQR